MNTLYVRRQLVNALVMTASLAATAFGLGWLLWIMATTLIQGASALDLKLFTQMTPAPGERGGLLNAFYGSFVMTLIALVIGTPLGVLAGTFLAEFQRKTRMGAVIRFTNDILLSAPSIVIGLFVYELVVRQVGHFSGWAGGLALAIILLPVVVRTTDEMLQLVPGGMREAALSLGLPKWKVSVKVLQRAASTGILTGVLLGLARISGETAPLLFTALNNQYWSATPNGPMANVPVVIFQYAMSPYDDWHAYAWAGAFVMAMFVLLLAVLSRAVLGRAKKHRP
ncbi:phosphate ABC transporter membrane protein 2, PhoT family [Dyella jiangningensis]|uniref:phosphate ABC transporter permease PstA n=1 Tax=Dyella sp. AtDHG13 TaxID=1938897 RepID=UPI00088E4951|nr:phosphate ABC transporter permease PstA [Dyella sp. AtDHG13]PXV55933.1 phosphate ABC transporter membrane protein 2 (PhoT family) [Dyella sp. AtDHG13]SDK50174.1 phosphate ABC transporter membrane protein 2, PhoT family [Dyella jiangningensis]